MHYFECWITLINILIYCSIQHAGCSPFSLCVDCWSGQLDAIILWILWPDTMAEWETAQSSESIENRRFLPWCQSTLSVCHHNCWRPLDGCWYMLTWILMATLWAGWTRDYTEYTLCSIVKVVSFLCREPFAIYPLLQLRSILLGLPARTASSGSTSTFIYITFSISIILYFFSKLLHCLHS